MNLYSVTVKTIATDKARTAYVVATSFAETAEIVAERQRTGEYLAEIKLQCDTVWMAS